MNRLHQAILIVLGATQGTVSRGVAYGTLLIAAGLCILGFAVDGE